MDDLPKSRAAHLRTTLLTVPPGGSDARAVPRPPGHLGLRRAAEIVEGAAYDLAGKESPVFISRLIEIAAELERHARSGQDSVLENTNARAFDPHS
jgi:hypothetical protein